VLDKENKCTYANTNAIIGLLMCTAAWINVKVLPVIAATYMSDKCKGDRKRRPRVQTQVKDTPIKALVDSGASVSVMSEKALRTVWEHWKMQRLLIPAALTVSGVNGKKIDVTGYVEIPLTIKDKKTDEVRSFTRPVLVLSGIGQTDLILGYDFIQEEGMVIDGAANETYFADRRAEGWRTGAPPPPEAQAAFNKLKEALMSAPIVVNPNREVRFILQTDASTGTESASGGMGAILLQEQNDKTERVVAYASRGLKDHEKNYPAFLLEKAAACRGIDYFDTYLTPPKQFTLCTDHNVNRPQENAK
jgi:hypothetical protein